MNLKRIGCQFFLHFGEYQEILFNEDQKIISIIGEWHNEPKRSNRSGKSSFVEIITYALYGETRAKKEISLINKNYPNEDMICELEFDDGVIIKRGRSSNNEIILDMTGHEGADKKVIQEEINKYVGLSYDDFIMTSYFIQGQIHTFMDAGPTGQKQIISRWLEKSYWKDFEQEAKNRIDNIQKEINKLQLIIDDKPDPARDKQIREHINILNTKKNTLEEQIEALNKVLEGINNQIEKYNDITNIQKSVRSIKSEIKIITEEINDLNEEIDEKNKSIPKAENNEKRLKALSAIDTNFLNDTKTLLDETKEKVKEKNQELATAKAEFKTLKSQHDNMEKFDNVCPITGNQCTSLDTIKSSKEDIRKKGIIKNSDIKKIESEIENLNEEVDTQQEKYDEIKDQLAEIKLREKEPTKKDIQDKINSLKEKIKTKEKFKKQKEESLKQEEKKLDELESIDIDEIKRKKIETNTKIVDNKKSLNDIINNVAIQQAELQQLKQKMQAAIKAEKDVKELIRRYNLHKYVVFMFGKNGIPSNQIESAFNEIEEEANIILDKINSDISLEFTPDRELDAWEPNCLVCGTPFPKGYRKTTCPECCNERQKKKKDELGIVINTGGNEIDFNLESGGGKVLISLSIRLAFVRLLQRRIGVNFKLIVFDEIFGMLDEVNRQYIFKLLAKTLTDDFDFNQILAISHEPDIRDSLPNIIKITKYNNYSTFNWD
jgi:exonuclease SbcC